MTLSEELAKRRSPLRGAHYDDVSGRLAAILDWLEGEPVMRRLMEELVSKVDVAKLFEGTRHDRRPRANTPEEIAAVGLQLIRECRENNRHFGDLCFVLNIRGRYDSSNVQAATDAGLEEYVDPFFDYVAEEVEGAAAIYSTSAVAEQRFSGLSSESFRRLLPETASHLDRIAAEFVRPDSEVAWQNVGNSCRQALIEFANELREACGSEIPEDVQAGNVKALLRHVSGSLFGDGRFKDSLLALVDAGWNHTQSITHRPATTKEEALRVFLWTGIVISEFIPPLQAYTEG